MTEPTSAKARIVTAAYEEIALHGVLEVRLRDVAYRSSCAVSLIHRHFGGREGLITPRAMRGSQPVLEERGNADALAQRLQEVGG